MVEDMHIVCQIQTSVLWGDIFGIPSYSLLLYQKFRGADKKIY
ncbi:hypothetical protein [Clostridioides difficile]|nr:hypothetical protein [Clostridioides difficile]